MEEQETVGDSELVIWDPDEVAGILCDAAASGTPAAIGVAGRTPVKCGISLSASGQLEVVLPCRESARVLAQGEASVLFHSRGQRWRFVAVFQNWRWSESDGCVHVSIGPVSEIHAYTFRRADRITLEGPLSSLTCQIDASHGTCSANVVDLSADGIGVALGDPEGGLPIDVGHRVVMTLEIDHLQCQMVAQLRWRRGKVCGFKFDRPIGAALEPGLDQLLKHIQERQGSSAA